MPTVSVNLSTDEYVQVNTNLNPILLQAHRDSVRVTLSDTKPAKSNSVFHVVGRDDPILQFNSIDANVWALATTETSSLIASETDAVKVGLYDSFGNPISSHSGAINVHDVDVHHQGVVRKFHTDPGIDSNLNGAVASGDITMTLVSATGFTVGKTITTGIDVTGGTQSFYEITIVVGNVITLDRPVDLALADATNIHVTEIDLSSTAGTLSSPVIYHVEPEIDAGWHITRLILTMTHSTSLGDLGLFGDLPRLTNGVLVRTNNNGSYGNITNWKDNSDIKIDFFDLEFDTRSGNKGTFGTSGRGTFTKLGMVVELLGVDTQSLEILIQDDITSLDTFVVSAQGHVLN